MKAINLLSPIEQKKHHMLAINRQMIGFGVWLVISLLIVAAVLFVSFIFRQTELESSRQVLAAKQDELKNLEEELVKADITELNADFSNLQVLRGQKEELSSVLVELARLMPRDLVADSLQVDLPNFKISIAGHAGTRSSVLEFRRNIIASDYFDNINFPLSNLEKAFDTSWSYEFSIDSGKLRKK